MCAWWLRPSSFSRWCGWPGVTRRKGSRCYIDTAIAGHGHIFPPEAPPPTEAEVMAQWEHWLGADRDRGRRAFVVAGDRDLIGVVLAGPDPDDARCG